MQLRQQVAAEVVVEHVGPEQRRLAARDQLLAAPVHVLGEAVGVEAEDLVEAHVEERRGEQRTGRVEDLEQVLADRRVLRVEAARRLPGARAQGAVARQAQQVLLVAGQRQGGEDLDLPALALGDQLAQLGRGEGAAALAHLRQAVDAQHVLDVGRVVADLERGEVADDAAEVRHGRDLLATDIVVVVADPVLRPVDEVEARRLRRLGEDLAQALQTPDQAMGVGPGDGDAFGRDAQGVALGPVRRGRQRGTAKHRGMRRQRGIGLHAQLQHPGERTEGRPGGSGGMHAQLAAGAGAHAAPGDERTGLRDDRRQGHGGSEAAVGGERPT
jgi:hypothetical protein